MMKIIDMWFEQGWLFYGSAVVCAILFASILTWIAWGSVL